MNIEYDCPQCGEATPALQEGYCPECCANNQAALDVHNSNFDRWERISDSQRSAEIENATR